ncbi:MAG: hypothetical protein QNK03_10760 [Myxococcota bacterium]|nr:hypothetical protein [Myxococcota bacterium]
MLRARPLLTLLALALLLPSAPAGAAGTPRFELHGFTELQLRTLSDQFQRKYWNASQWAHVLNLEAELDVAPDGFGPFDLISAFSRVEVRFDCIWTGCGIAPTWRYNGDRANSTLRNYADGRTNPYRGVLKLVPREGIHSDNELLPLPDVALSALVTSSLIDPAAVESTFGRLLKGRYSGKDVDASLGNAVFPMGPWRPEDDVRPNGSLRDSENTTLGLPLRPLVPNQSPDRWSAQGLFVPSDSLQRRRSRFDQFDQRFSQNELQWNHGASQQDEYELRELYADLEAIDGRLWMRIGKQTIVWGKTELFRTTDQYNPQDLALSSLPSLEESRIPNWAMRAVWSFWDVGPLSDVRLEVAANFDDFEPLDLGQCGEPYTVWIVCGKRFGLTAHGWAGVGIAGEERPSDPWKDIEGWEIGARVEFRWDRFSFQISDFYGYEDAPVIENFNEYSRNVDVATGRPLTSVGTPLLPDSGSDFVLQFHPSNRQVFDVVCSITKGLAGDLLPGTEDRCLVDVLNASDVTIVGISIPEALGVVLGGSAIGEGVAGLISGVPVELVELNQDPLDDPFDEDDGSFDGIGAVSEYLTVQQQALLGCGDFYDTNCDTDGIDLFNAEASVLLQEFPMFEPGGPVATRPVNGVAVTLPGARSIDDPAYDALVDGCVQPGPFGCNAGDLGRTDDARVLTHPFTGEQFDSELGALSFNFLNLIASLGVANEDDPECVVDSPETCELVRGVIAVAGVTRPEVKAGGNGRFGRRTFVWAGGTEIAFRYRKRNVLGFAFDFAHDPTATNWGVEATWFHDQPFQRSDSRRGWVERDVYNVTISIDRPTFIDFLNQNRTFFFNSQWFIRVIDDYRDGKVFAADGPISALATFTVATGYFQDRLLPSLTFVHDISSTSGALIGQLTYRFSQDFSITVGGAGFYGQARQEPTPLSPPLVQNQGGSYRARTRYQGLSPIAERDELFLRLRYTF